MTDNMMPGDNRGAEPQEHYQACPAYDHEDAPCVCDALAREYADVEAEAQLEQMESGDWYEGRQP